MPSLVIGKKVVIGKFGSPFAPTDISGLVGWFDMQDSSSFTNSGGFISAITNKATSVSWTEATNQPAYNTTAINGLPAMDFDGTNDKINSTTDTTLISTLNGDNAFTLFYVAKFDTVDRAESVFGIANSATNNGFRGFGQNTTASGTWQANGNTTGAVATIVDSAGGSNANNNIFEWYSSGGNISLQVNGGSADPNASSWAVGSTPSVNRASLGSRPRLTNDHFFDGKLGELIFYNSNLSSTNRASVRTYLSTKWNITVL